MNYLRMKNPSMWPTVAGHIPDVSRHPNIVWHLHLACGFDATMELSKQQSQRLLEVKTLAAFGTPSTSQPLFGNLPPEIRQIIFGLILTDELEGSMDIKYFDKVIYPSCLGDLSGFYTPFQYTVAILELNLATRAEALPLAFRCLTFRLYDLAGTFRLLASIGKIERANITKVDLGWLNYDETVQGLVIWYGISNSLGEECLGYIEECMTLLANCGRLRFLRLRVTDRVRRGITLEELKRHHIIKQLCRVQTIEQMDILDNQGCPMAGCECAEWLKREVEIGRRRRRIVSTDSK